MEEIRLKHYFKDGGVGYFLVYVDEEYRTDIYYNLLTPAALRTILYEMKDSGSKSASVVFDPVPESSDEFTEILKRFHKQCLLDRKRLPLEPEDSWLAERLKEYEKTFVETALYRKAAALLDQQHVLILCGDPGIGKTALACRLALRQAGGDRSRIVSTASLDSVFASYGNRDASVFLLDDFWGSTRYEGNGNREKLKAVMEAVRSSRSQRLILTSRDYILQKETAQDAAFGSYLSAFCLSCGMDSYTPAEKLSIMFSHLKASDLPWDYMHCIYERAEEIIDVCGFNPRIAAMMLESADWREMSPEEYAEEYAVYMEYPYEFWKSVAKELSTDTVVLLLFLLSFSGEAYVDDLKRAYEIYARSEQALRVTKSFYECLTEAKQSVASVFLPVDADWEVMVFRNPAIEDLLFGVLWERPSEYIPILLKACFSFNQIDFFSQCSLEKLDGGLKHALADKCMEAYGCLSLIHVYNGENYYDENHPEFEHELFYLDRTLELYDRMREERLGVFLQQKLDAFCHRLAAGGECDFFDLERFPKTALRAMECGLSLDLKDAAENYQIYLDNVLLFRQAKVLADAIKEKGIVLSRPMEDLVSGNIEERILWTLRYFNSDDRYDTMSWILLDEIPQILEEHGLKYTQELQEKVRELAGYQDIPLTPETPVRSAFHVHRMCESEAGKYLKDPDYLETLQKIESYLVMKACEDGGQRAADRIRNSGLRMELKERLLEILEDEKPWYIYEVLAEEETLSLSLDTLEEFQILIEDLGIFYMLLLSRIGGTDQISTALESMALLAQLFMDHGAPYLRETEVTGFFDRLDGGRELFDWLCSHGALTYREGWYCPVSVPLCLFCLAKIYSGWESDEKESLYQELFGKSIYESRFWSPGEIGFGHADMYQLNMRNKNWESLLLRMFYDLDEDDFYQYYLKKMARELSLAIGDPDSRTDRTCFLKELHLTVKTDEKGETVSIFYLLPASLLAFEQLGLGALYDCILRHAAHLSGRTVTADASPGEMDALIDPDAYKGFCETVQGLL